MFHGTSRIIGCSSAVLLVFTTSALPEDNKRIQDAKRIAGKVQGAAKAASLWSDGKDLMDLQAARLNGTPSPQQTDNAVKALDSIGSQTSGAAAVALGGRVAGVVSAVQAAALMPVVKSVGSAANKRGSRIAELMEATRTGAVDLAKVETIGKAYDADTAELGKWEVDYGSSWETLKRVAQSMSVNVGSSSVAFLSNAIQSTQGFLDGLEAEETTENTTDTQTGWRQSSFGASYVNRPPLADQCFELPKTIEAYTKLQAHELTSSMGCTINNLSIINAGNSVFTYSCQHNSQSATSGSFEIYMTDTKIRTIRREKNTHVGEMKEEAIYEPCDPEPDCSPAGQAAWRAAHNGAPAYMCGNPL